MKKLYKHTLDFNITYSYVRDNLNNVNLLSDEILKTVNFQNGSFFTLLPKDAYLSNILEFNTPILKQNDLIDYDENPSIPEIYGVKKGKYQLIPTMQEEVCFFITKQIKKNNLSCVLDDVIRHSTDSFHIELYHSCGLNNGKEIYYVVNDKNISIEILDKCLSASHSFWHSVCVLTEATFNNNSKMITVEKIEEICKKVRMIIIGAYDGEGYVFWEPKNRMKEKDD